MYFPYLKISPVVMFKVAFITCENQLTTSVTLAKCLRRMVLFQLPPLSVLTEKEMEASRDSVLVAFLIL